MSDVQCRGCANENERCSRDGCKACCFCGRDLAVHPSDFQRGYDYAIMLIDVASASAKGGGRLEVAMVAEELAKLLREITPHDGLAK